MSRKEYNVTATIATRARITSDTVVEILKSEFDDLLGGEHRYINENGEIYECDNRFSCNDYIRDATDEEIEIAKAYKLVMKHLASSK